MSVTVITGEQRGDEGKGRFVDMLAADLAASHEEDNAIVARYNGGNNAGHTIVLKDGRVLKLHMVPSGIAHEHTTNVIGNGTLVNPVNLVKEIATIEAQGVEVTPDRLLISSSAHLILPTHISADEIREAGAGKQGSTKSGIAQTAADKYLRYGVRAEMINNGADELVGIVREGLEEEQPLRLAEGLPPIDIDRKVADFAESLHILGSFVTDTCLYLNRRLKAGASVLAEGAQAFLLDVDHGMYPYTTSSSTTAGGAATGLGIPPKYIQRVVGVSKAVQSHVGDGPFVTEITDEGFLDQLHGDMTTVDAERGTTTGRTRRLGHLDLLGIRRAQMVNGTGEMALTKLDWVPRYGRSVLICTSYTRKGKELTIAPDAAYKLDESTPNYAELPTWDEDIQGVRTFSDLPLNAQRYIEFIEEQTEVPITMIGVGPQRDQVIVRNS